MTPFFLVPGMKMDSILVYLGFDIISSSLSISTSSGYEVFDSVGGETVDSSSSDVQE